MNYELFHFPKFVILFGIEAISPEKSINDVIFSPKPNHFCTFTNRKQLYYIHNIII